MGALMLFGLVVMYAIGPQRAHVLNNAFSDANYTDTHFFVRQSMYLIIAIGAFITMAKLPVSWLRSHTQQILLTAFLLCTLLAIGGAVGLPIVPEIGGAYRWFNFGGFASLQPSEMLKFAILIFGAAFLALRVRENSVNDRDASLIPMAIVLAAASFFVIVLQKDMGTGMSLLAIVVAMYIAAGANKKVGAIAIAAILLAGVALIIAAPHRMERVAAFLAGDSVTTSNDETYQIAHAKIAIGSGGLTGVGIGNSVQATGYLPEVINDAVFAVLGEMFGFVGLVIILGLYGGLLIRLLSIADRSAEPLLRFIAVGIFGWLAAHVIINVGSVTGLMPLTGITLPLLSFGGTSMIVMSAVLGLAFQISQYTQYDTVKNGGYNEGTRSRRGVGRSRHANRSRTT